MKLGEVEDSQFKFINRHLSLLLFFQILIKTVIKIYIYIKKLACLIGIEEKMVPVEAVKNRYCSN